MIPIAIQLYSVREEMKKDFEGSLAKIHEMGYDGVEFAGLYDRSPKEIKEILEKYSLEPVCAHISLAETLEDIDKVINTYKEIGCKYLAIPYLENEYRPGTPKYGETLKMIESIGKRFAEEGIVLLYHNHDFEFVKIDGEYGLDVMYSTIPAEYLQTELDTCWVNVGGENPAEYILKYSGRTPIIHLKDFVMKGREMPKKLYALIGIDDDQEQEVQEDFSFKPIGYGVQDIPAIIAAAEKSGAKWFVVEQDRPDNGNTELSAAKKSVDFLKSL